MARLPSAEAAPSRRPTAQPLGALAERLNESELSIVAAEKAAAKEIVPTEAELAKQLMQAQVELHDGDYERAAIRCLDLVENHPDTVAAIQARYYLGVALVELEMQRWAVEFFAAVLADGRSESRQFHQRTVARFLDLSAPRRAPGFARRTGLSALPELRARLESAGVSTQSEVLQGPIQGPDLERLVRWAQSFPADAREPDLRYAYGRYLYLTGAYEEARAELDLLNPLDIPMSRGGEFAEWRLRSAYIAAACSAALGDAEDVKARFILITEARPTASADREIVDLAWLALGRFHHDESEGEDAIRAYRAIGRDSVYFHEALYETAWTLLELGLAEQASQALDLLLEYEPRSPIAAEIKQLRAKVKILARDYVSAQTEFLALRTEFSKLAKTLGAKLRTQGNAGEYFAAVVSDELEHFSLRVILPETAVPVAEGLASANAAVTLARDTGYLVRQLDDLRELLSLMEQAVAARERGRLFSDLGAHVASLDNVDIELVAIREALIGRLVAAAKTTSASGEGIRRSLKRQLDAANDPTGIERRKIVATLEHLEEQQRALRRVTDGLRAELVATEHVFGSNPQPSERSSQIFLEQAARLRRELVELERATDETRRHIASAQAALRFSDPLRQPRQDTLVRYVQQLVRMYGTASRRASDDDVDTLWRRVEAAQERSRLARVALDDAAALRLAAAQQILIEERANLDQYLAELQNARATVEEVVGEVMNATFRDVVNELDVLSLRSEVGLLDVAWAKKDFESTELERLEKTRDANKRDLDASTSLGLEELRP